MVLSAISLQTPDGGISREPGGYMVAVTATSLPDVNGKFHQVTAGQTLLVTELNPSPNYRNPWKFRLLSDKVVLQTVSTHNFFIYINPSKKLLGKSFCITGELTHVRPTYVSLIRLSGGEFRTAMSGQVDYLVTNKNHHGTKAKKAKSLGTKIITELQLLELLYLP